MGNDMFSFILSYDELIAFLRREPEEKLHGLEILVRFGKYAQELDVKMLNKVIYMIYGKWPHTSSVEIRRRGIKRAIQSKYYQQIYGNEITDSIKRYDEQCILDLQLEELEKEGIIEPELVSTSKPKKKSSSQPKIKKPMTKFSKMIREMSLEQVISWAKKEGVTEEQINKHMNKSSGLAKMNISNLIRSRLIKSNKFKSYQQFISSQQSQPLHVPV